MYMIYIYIMYMIYIYNVYDIYIYNVYDIYIMYTIYINIHSHRWGVSGSVDGAWVLLGFFILLAAHHPTT